MERNARSQARVIEDLLDVSRMATGKLRVKMSVVDLCAVLTAAVDAVKPMATAKSLQLTLDAAGAVSRAPTATGCSRSPGTCSPTR